MFIVIKEAISFWQTAYSNRWFARLSNIEFNKSKEFLCGKNGFLYDNYWTIKKNK